MSVQKCKLRSMIGIEWAFSQPCGYAMHGHRHELNLLLMLCAFCHILREDDEAEQFTKRFLFMKQHSEDGLRRHLKKCQHAINYFARKQNLSFDDAKQLVENLFTGRRALVDYVHHLPFSNWGPDDQYPTIRAPMSAHNSSNALLELTPRQKSWCERIRPVCAGVFAGLLSSSASNTSTTDEISIRTPPPQQSALLRPLQPPNTTFAPVGPTTFQTHSSNDYTGFQSSAIPAAARSDQQYEHLPLHSQGQKRLRHQDDHNSELSCESFSLYYCDDLTFVL